MGNPASTDKTKKGKLTCYGLLRSNAQKTETRKMRTISERLYSPKSNPQSHNLKNEVSQMCCCFFWKTFGKEIWKGRDKKNVYLPSLAGRCKQRSQIADFGKNSYLSLTGILLVFPGFHLPTLELVGHPSWFHLCLQKQGRWNLTHLRFLAEIL